ncbi:SLATT domain-containing protein [Alloscardovia theropitheci]|uniref:SLATT domain-containing protein n=1 Tax=Alloscardovia theropitheci TaxID=2496842 RepID=A0A4V2MTW8_9BIFI|nr:SLATT domain-containing protein [Alloscardovia theropitheci]TCD54119.1 SLATT domain-containing protein [Alloscardovia theropitheci]
MTEYRLKLLGQIRESYAKATYTYTTQQVMLTNTIRKNSRLKTAQIILSSISTVGVLTNLITNKYWLTVTASITTALLLALNLYFKDTNLSEDILRHEKAIHELWEIREKYLTLLTDFRELDDKTICQKRDTLIQQLSTIYKEAPRTNNKAYQTARNMLKDEEYQYFTDTEIDLLLPVQLRMLTFIRCQQDKR